MPKVLIVDDDPDFREICRLCLENEGFQVVEAADADEGLAKVQSEDPDLIVLDVLMPDNYEGFDLARKIREDLKRCDLPVLMLTAVHTAKKVPYRFAPDETWLPVDLFLEKPVLPWTLLEQIRAALGM